jgi:integrase
MATFEQRESGYWQAKIRRKGYPMQSKTHATKADAERWARSVEAEMDKGAFVALGRAERTTFAELAVDFEKNFAPHHYRGMGWRHKLGHLRTRLDDYSLLAITAPVVAKYRDDRLKDPDPRYKRDLDRAPRVSGATVKTEIDLLSKMLDWAQKECGIALPAGNPVAGIRKPKAGKARDRRLTGEEWEALEKECRASQNPWLWPAVQLAVETAMRQGELLSLRWQDIDKKRRLALLLDPDKIKTEEPRAVPLSSAAIEALGSLPKAIKGQVIPQARMTLYKAFEGACKRAGIVDYTWHDLRHEALSRLAERGDFTVLELAAVSGHKTLQMLKRYTHLQAEKLAEKLAKRG